MGAYGLLCDAAGHGYVVPLGLHVVQPVDAQDHAWRATSETYAIDGVKAYVVGNSAEDLRVALETGAAWARRELQDHQIMAREARYLLWYEFDIAAHIVDDSAGLLGALAFADYCLTQKLGKSVPFAYAATGRITATPGAWQLQAVAGLAAKIAAAVTRLERGSQVFYPQIQASEITPALQHHAADKGIVLYPVWTVEDALTAFLCPVKTSLNVLRACPYRGLEVFEEEHAPLFFGREAVTQRLVQAARAMRQPHQEGAVPIPRVLVVLGPSGSGKSSLLRAGLLPRLRAGALLDSQAWEYHLFTPGPYPLEALADQLACTRLPEPLHLPQARLQQGATAVQALQQQACHLTTQIDAPRLCLLVDQCEEVFTLCQDRAEREGFLALLQHVATAADGPTLVIIAMRADFVGQATHYAALADMLSRGPGSPFLVTPMTDQELRRAIIEPARVVGVSVEDVLVETVVQEVSREPGLLPLMAYALAQLWTTRRSDNVLTLRAYRYIGGVHGALTKRAEEVFMTFTPAQQQVARHILLRLTQPGEGTEATRRRAMPAELVTQTDDQGMIAQVVQLMADARLLVTREDGQIAVAHEALIRGWDRLQMWLDQDREFLLWQQRLRVAIADWERTQDDDALLRGSLLAEAERQLAERSADLSPFERQFIEASQARRDHEVHSKEAQRQRELAAARQLAIGAEGRRRAQRRMMRVWAAGFLATLVISGIALKEWHRANIAQAKAEAHYLASQAALVLDTTGEGLIRSGLLATESLRRTPTLAGYQAWARVVTLLPEESVRFLHPGVRAVAFSPDGTRLVTGSEDKTARV
jgi:hypothetical protein